MCNFFSLVSNGKGTIYYFDWKLRKQILKGKLKIGNNKITEADSHSSILEYLQDKRKYIGNDFDKKFNKYEFNPLTKEFIIDRIDTKDDSDIVKKKCLELDFSKIIEPLIIKKIINPFQDKKRNKINKKDIDLLKQWSLVWSSVESLVWSSVESSVWSSVWFSVGSSVGSSVESSVGSSVWSSVESLVWSSVGSSVWSLVWSSVESLVGSSVGFSVESLVWGYISSFFNINKWEYIDHKKGINPYQCMIDLWNKGIVPSYDGKIWRLHGHKGKIIWEDKNNIIK